MEQNILFGYKKADETRRQFHLLLWNVYNFFVTYALADGWSKEVKSQTSKVKSTHVLDAWMLSRLNGLIDRVTTSLHAFDASTAAHEIEAFVTDLSQWYVRRSRDRVGPSAQDQEDKDACYSTLYHVLVTLIKLIAPMTPFLADEIYANLTGEANVYELTYEGVHEPDSEYYSAGGQSDVGNQDVEAGKARELIREIQMLRKEKGCKIDERVSLTLSDEYTSLSDALLDLVKRETLATGITWGPMTNIRSTG